ncbi:DUF5133 domain-containing protein [Streptomyces sp. NPDC056883]|uniref:DUF5133 domain-containing protein n=1 Tax=Streptomyces sp. NPDC056883 TaxID=3345959 RepID=UPI0036A3806A
MLGSTVIGRVGDGHLTIRDVEHALCVATGTADVHAALMAARHRLPGAGALDDSVLDSH